MDNTNPKPIEKENAFSIQPECIDIICRSLHIAPAKIRDIQPLKTGMTNRSFFFTCENVQYIFRIPGEGTGKLINRQNEYNVYQQIKNKDICDDVIYFSAETGYKITRYIPHSRNCNPQSTADVKRCMSFLKHFHQNRFSVAHTFDVFQTIEYYESLMDAVPRQTDYLVTKRHVFSLKAYIDAQPKDFCLTHIDAVPDNFLLTDDRVYLIDWEYAAMQDPHLDIAMFAIYALYDRAQIDALIDIYFENTCPKETRLKIYCYVAMCGLLWSNWCEYKASLGVTFDEYAEKQYQYAKDFYQFFMEEKENA